MLLSSLAENLLMKKILVTGGAGYIGSHTVVELLNAGYQPVIVDNLSNSNALVLQRLTELTGVNIPFYALDCCDKAAMTDVFEKEQFSGVIHFAAFKAVGESVAEPLSYYRNNLLSMLVVAELMQQFKVQHLVFSSSCTVYGEPDMNPVPETAPQKTATSPYGYSKQVCERMLNDLAHIWPQAGICLLRYFNPVGAHPSGLIGELPNGVPNNLVPFITQTAAGIRPQLTVFGNDYDTTDGSCIRDFIHVVDLAQAHVHALRWCEGHEGRCEAFNIGQGIGNSVLEAVEAFTRVTTVPLNFTVGPRRPGDVVKVWADVTKATQELGWKTQLTLEDALRDAWKWQLTLAR